MILVAGLGNIGKEYENTRHNAGFMLLDLLFSFLNGAKFDFSFAPSNFTSILKIFPFSDFSSKSLINKPNFKGELIKYNSLLLLKPHTFMNASGLSIEAVYNFYKCQRLIVLHDDLDLNLGALKFKKAGSSGGHNGLKSIDERLGNEYERVRFGIGKPLARQSVIDFVLGKFTALELAQCEPSFKIALLALLELIAGENITQVNAKFSLKNALDTKQRKN